jgi:DNA-binding MarR family transcriptional regulator
MRFRQQLRLVTYPNPRARRFSGWFVTRSGRATLAEVYNWFTEGFVTADLKDAKALLDDLSAKEN